MKILFILPYDTTYRYKTAFIPSISYEPLTLSTLAALVPKELNAKITLVDEGVQRFNYTKEQYDIVGITATTSSAPRAYELANYFKSCGSYVLLGGHHVSLMPDEAQKHCDSVFVGSAEVTFPQFFVDYRKGIPQKRYSSNGVQTCRIPIPRRDLMRKKGYLKQPTIIADYGCPNSCKFCVIHSFWGNKAKRNVIDVINEIKLLNKREFILLDPSPFADRLYAKELLTELSKLKVKWVGLATLDIAKNEEMLDLLQKSGCIGLLCGFETFNSSDLADLSKRNNIDEYKKIVQKIHRRKISVLGTFMIGLDSDTKESLKQLPKLIEEVQIDIPRFAILTPYPNTPLFHKYKAENRIVTEDWSKYDSIHSVISPRNLSSEETEQELIDIWNECYKFKRIFKRLNFTPQRKLTAFVTNIAFKIYANRIKKILGKR